MTQIETKLSQSIAGLQDSINSFLRRNKISNAKVDIQEDSSRCYRAVITYETEVE